MNESDPQPSLRLPVQLGRFLGGRLHLRAMRRLVRPAYAGLIVLLVRGEMLAAHPEARIVWLVVVGLCGLPDLVRAVQLAREASGANELSLPIAKLEGLLGQEPVSSRGTGALNAALIAVAFLAAAVGSTLALPRAAARVPLLQMYQLATYVLLFAHGFMEVLEAATSPPAEQMVQGWRNDLAAMIAHKGPEAWVREFGPQDDPQDYS